MAAVQLRGVRKSFPARKGEDVEVLKGIDVDVASGEFLAILGSSGCGKSTLLRLISGLELATGGSILIDGADVTGLSPEKRELAMVFQNYALFPHLNVRENILFGLKSRGEPKQLRAERLAETAELLGLDELLDRRPAELSGGQRQRVALGRALVSGQRLVLMDEPLSNLDAKLRAEMRVEIKRIQRQLGLTIIYVTHDQVEAMTMADRVMMMASGRVEQLAAPEDLYGTPASTTVARFIGSPPMNIVEVAPGSSLADLLPADLRDSGAALGVRPESLDLHPSAQHVPAGRLAVGEATVLVNELLGADRIISTTLSTGSGGSQRMLVRTEPSRAVSTDEQVTLSARAEDLHWYSRETGRRLQRDSAEALTSAPA
ncbi:ABC transporter ATP-binding protein [Nesterenkonia flava]|uniref:ATP-binding cassette domain-containing protein n=1 Tax=Nesterenkonia flava TaxID=469799 RepID=A0ABU1FQQ7_9MICC|nr:ATP-binding cassette domain-containing protein [Nesterenkonia flava]MDR5710976.1 ATP-binding cassette domain-containing protein [Nesterenkonia flava]